MVQNVDPEGPNYVEPTPNAVEAKRKPVQGARSQDADPDSNDGKTYVTENGVQPPQPNDSSLRQ